MKLTNFIIKITAQKCTPSFSKEFVDKRPVIGETVVFKCNFAGNPKPGITHTISPTPIQLAQNRSNLIFL